VTETPISILAPRMIARPRCPECGAPARVQCSTAVVSGFQHWRLRCTKCGHVHEADVPADPMASEAKGWLAGELRAPT
jgi:transcription elongation factor Elf1